VWGGLLVCGRLAIGIFDLPPTAGAITNRPLDAIPPHIRRAVVIVKMLHRLQNARGPETDAKQVCAGRYAEALPICIPERCISGNDARPWLYLRELRQLDGCQMLSLR
jgi:hypothetical protein